MFGVLRVSMTLAAIFFYFILFQLLAYTYTIHWKQSSINSSNSGALHIRKPHTKLGTSNTNVHTCVARQCNLHAHLHAQLALVAIPPFSFDPAVCLQYALTMSIEHRCRHGSRCFLGGVSKSHISETSHGLDSDRVVGPSVPVLHQSRQCYNHRSALFYMYR